MSDITVRIGLGDTHSLVAVEDVDVTPALLLTLRQHCVAGLEDAVRSPELRALVTDDEEPEADVAPEDVAGTDS